jgi:LPS-assembly lipoprotein
MLLSHLTPFLPQRFWQNSGLMLLIAALSSCGFQLRQPNPVSFKTVQLSGNTQITSALKKSLKEQNIQLVETAEEAELQVELMHEENEKRILSLSGTGVVREYELYYRVQYRTKASDEPTWGLPLVMESRRDYTYNDSNLLAKLAEEKRLAQTMRTDVLNGIMRRLSALKKAQ